MPASLRKLFTVILLAFAVTTAQSQCSRFETFLTDGFEYTTVCPDIVPGMVIHNTPQTFGVRSGTRALYLNMIDCNGGAGTCAGDSVYIRTVTCCPAQPIRFRWWMKTVFTGTLSDIRVVLADGNDNILADVPSTVAPFGSWLQFTSPEVIPGTFVVKLKIYTNIDGQNGNDLGIDDMEIQRCATSSLTNVTACNNFPSIDLFSSIPGTPVTSGTWSGPSSLGGGYTGTYIPGTSVPGTYVYNSTPYGTGGACLAVNDSVIVSTGITPQPNLGNDTTVCVNQPLVLNPGTSSPGLSYQWSNFSTTPTVTAFSGTATATTYTVTVTSSNGCTGRDSIHITFQVCSGLNENGNTNVKVYPNPAKNHLNIRCEKFAADALEFTLTSADGKAVFKQEIKAMETRLELPSLPAGMYIFTIGDKVELQARGRITIE